MTPPTIQIPPTAERIERLLMESELMASVNSDDPGIWSMGEELLEEKQDVIRSTANTMVVIFATTLSRGQKKGTTISVRCEGLCQLGLRR